MTVHAHPVHRWGQLWSGVWVLAVLVVMQLSVPSATAAAPDCCAPASLPGCASDPLVELCVCDMDPYCCSNQWDSICVGEAENDCGLDCGATCCDTTSAAPGCAEAPLVEACVCEMDGYCCSTAWDGLCVNQVPACAHLCEEPPPDEDPCCTQPADTPGCAHAAVEQCVCDLDPYCCDNHWDGLCAQESAADCAEACLLPEDDPCEVVEEDDPYAPSQPVNTSTVGRIEGTFSVSDDGSAMYEIPIVVPPGPGGLEPELKLTYDSTGGNGLLGVGFRLDGLSTVTRCGRDFSNGSSARPVSFDSGDRFCLDGEPLVAVSGPYGADLTQYRTRQDRFSRIVGYGVGGEAGTQRFSIVTRDGMLLSYGGTEDSRVGAFPQDDPADTLGIFAWSLDRVTDRHGNVMTITWHKEQSEPGEEAFARQRPASIQYTAHANGAPAERQVVFSYAPDGRPDPERRYVHGVRMGFETRMTGIRTFGPGPELVRHYVIEYLDDPEDVSGKSKISAVLECTAAGDCKPPTTFEWTDPTTNYGAQGFGPGPPRLMPGAANVLQSVPNRATVVDLDGNGCDDLAWTSLDRWYVRPSTCDGMSQGVQDTGVDAVDGRHRYVWAANGNFEYVYPIFHLPTAQVLDYDGDGRDDLLLHDGEDEIRILTRNSDFVDQLDWQLDVIETGIDVPNTCAYSWLDGIGKFRTLDTTAEITVADVDGDGRSDLLYKDVVEGSVRQVVRLLGDHGFSSPALLPEIQRACSGIHSGEYVAERTMQLADIDGDGATELLVADDLEEPIEFRAYHYAAGFAPTGIPFWRANGYFFPDINGDGLPDVLFRHVFDEGADGPEVPTQAFRDTWPELDEYAYYYQVNRGDGSFTRPIRALGPEAQVFSPDPDQLPDAFIKASYFASDARVIDYDFDGKQDVLVPFTTNDVKEWYLMRAQEEGEPFALEPTGLGVCFEMYTQKPHNGYASVDPLYTLDVNGDGMHDIGHLIWCPAHLDDQASAWHIRVGEAPDLVERIEDGYGRRILVDYDRATKMPVDRGAGEWPIGQRHHPRMLVSRYRTDNGVAGGLDEFHMQYAGGRFDRRTGALLGFERVTRIDETRSKRTDTFSTVLRDDQTGGLAFVPDRSEQWVITGDGEVHSTWTERTWDIEHHNDGQTFSVRETETLTRSYTYDVLLEHGGLFDADPQNHQSTIPVEGLEPWRTVVETFARDAYANLTLHRRESYRHAELMSTHETIYEVDNDLPFWTLGLVTRADTIVWSAGHPALARATTWTYSPDTGALVSSTVEPERPDLTLTTTFLHDWRGNIVETTKSDDAGVSRTWTVDYDDEAAFAVCSTNPAGHREGRVHDRSHGVPVKRTDPNVRSTHWQLDGFGRTVLERGPSHVDATTVYGSSQQFPLIITRAKPGVPTTRISSDRLGRSVLTETRGLGGVWIQVATTYDALGHVASVALPTFEGDVPAGAHEFSHDELGRRRFAWAPYGGDPQGRQVEYRYTPYSKETIGPNGHSHTLGYDVDGRVVTSVDALGSKTTFDRDAFGLPLEIRDAADNVVSLEYDALGRRVVVDDPDMGTRQFTFDAYGDLVSETNARGQNTAMSYDALGRLVQRVTEDAVTTWTWDTSAHGVGQVASVQRAGASLVEESQAYDELGNPTCNTTTVDGDSFEACLTYDERGNVAALQYPTVDGMPAWGVLYDRDPHGRLVSIRDAGTNAMIWRLEAEDAAERMTHVSLGNGLETRRFYDAGTGSLDIIVTHDPAGGLPLQALSYEYDAAGNLTGRSDALRDLGESFSYDELHRLTHAESDGPYGLIKLDYQYDALGNILFKTGVGDYEYGQGAGPHAATKAGELELAYDLDGNCTSRGDMALSWSSSNKLSSVTRDGAQVSFVHDGDDARARKTSEVNGRQITYIGKLFEHEENPGGVLLRHFVRDDDGGVIAIMERPRTLGGVWLPDELRWLHTDVLGSTHAVSDEDGMEVSAHSTSPFGVARDPETWGEPELAQPVDDLARGYTGHRHDADLGLVDMEVRPYDPVLGRFLSPDPVVQYPHFSQSLNRYSYVLNNPLSHTDPSGFSSRAVSRRFKTYEERRNALSLAMVKRPWASANHQQRMMVRFQLKSGKYRASVVMREQDEQVQLIQNAKTAAEVAFIGLQVYTGIGAARLAAKGAVELGAEWLGQEALNAASQKLLGVPLIGPRMLAGRAGGRALQARNTAARARKAQRSAPKSKAGTPKCAGCTCFVPGTLVLMADGSALPIEEVEIGDEVLAVDPESDASPEAHAVLDVHRTETGRVLHLEIATEEGVDQGEIQSTGRHAYWTLDRGWQRAEDITAGTRLLDASGATVHVTDVWTEYRETPTFNLTVDGPHTFFVISGDAAVLVHNVDPWDMQFSQDSISPNFSNTDDVPERWRGRPVKEAIEEASRLRRLPDGLKIHAMEVNNRWVTLNNRTLYVAQQANLLNVHPVDMGPSGTNKLNKLLRDAGLPGPVDSVTVRCP